jgi:hypothetical protein
MRLREKTDGAGIPLILLLQYSGGQVSALAERPSRAAALLQRTGAAGIVVVDCWEPLKSLYSEEGTAALKGLYVMHDRGRRYGHMSSRGNRFTAHLLARRLRDHIPGPVRKGS